MKALHVCAFTFAFTGLTATTANAQDISMWLISAEGLDEFVAQAEEQFEASHPDVDIIFESFPNESYKTQIQVALTGSEPPDVFFNWAGEDSARLVRDGLAADLTDMGTYKDFVSEGWLSAFEYDGRNYGVPHEAVSKYFYYDPVFFEDNDLQVPSSFAELKQLCGDIRAIDDSIVPWPMGNSERWMMNHLITMLNQRVLGQKATAADYALTADDADLFTDPGYAEAWTRVIELMDARCFQDAPNATSPESGWSMFAANVSPLIYCGTWCGNIFADQGFDSFQMFRFPSLEGGAGDPGGQFLVSQGLMVSAKSEHADLAAEWISFMVSDEQAKNYAELVGNIVSNPALIDEVDGTDYYKFYVSDVAEATSTVSVLDVLLEASVANAYLDAGVEILNRTMTPEEAMESIRSAALAAKGG